MSACPDCRCRVIAVVALADLLDDARRTPRAGELLELADDAPTLHLYVVDGAARCAHRHWRDPATRSGSTPSRRRARPPPALTPALRSTLARASRCGRRGRASVGRTRVARGSRAKQVRVDDRGGVEVDPEVQVAAVRQHRHVHRHAGARPHRVARLDACAAEVEVDRAAAQVRGREVDRAGLGPEQARRAPRSAGPTVSAARGRRRRARARGGSPCSGRVHRDAGARRRRRRDRDHDPARHEPVGRRVAAAAGADRHRHPQLVGPLAELVVERAERAGDTPVTKTSLMLPPSALPARCERVELDGEHVVAARERAAANMLGVGAVGDEHLAPERRRASRRRRVPRPGSWRGSVASRKAAPDALLR